MIQVRHKPRRFAHVVVERVVDELAVADARVAAQARGIERIGVVMTDAVHRADAGKDALAAAAETGHHMMRTRAQADHLVRARGLGVDAHVRAVRRRADGNEIRRVAVMVDDADAVENRVGHKRAQLVFIAAIVRAVGNENRQVRIRHAAALVEIRHQRGDHLVLPHPETRHIADDERHAVARRDPRGQRQRVNRRVQRLCQRRGNILDGRHAVSMQLAQHVFHPAESKRYRRRI